jgi:hypothetical protein
LFSVSVAKLCRGYFAFPNVAIKDSNGNADFVGGSGGGRVSTGELLTFMRNIAEREWLKPEDFLWSDSVDRFDGR